MIINFHFMQYSYKLEHDYLISCKCFVTFNADFFFFFFFFF